MQIVSSDVDVECIIDSTMLPEIPPVGGLWQHNQLPFFSRLLFAKPQEGFSSERNKNNFQSSANIFSDDQKNPT